MLVTSNYVNRDELMLDLTVYGTLIQDSFKLDEFKELVKQEYLESRQRDLRTRPTSLSGLVSPDYAVQYDELELDEDEDELDFSELSSNNSKRFKSVEEVDAYIDRLRDEILASGDEDAIANLRRAEESFGSVKEAEYVPHDVSEDSDEVQVWHTAKYDENEDLGYEDYTASIQSEDEYEDEVVELVDLTEPDEDSDDEEEYVDLSVDDSDEEEYIDMTADADDLDDFSELLEDSVSESEGNASVAYSEFDEAEYGYEDENFESLDLSEIFEIDEALLSSLEEDEDNSDFEDEGVSEPEDFDEDSDDYDEWDDSDSEDALDDAEEEDSDGEIESDYAESTDSSDESDSEDFEDDEWSDDLQDEEDDDSLIQTSQVLDSEDDEDDDWDDQDASESDDEDEWADDEPQDDEIESDEDDDFDEDWSDIHDNQEEAQGIQPHVDEVSVKSSQHMVDTSAKEVKRVTKKPDKQRKETSDSSFDDFLASVPRQVVQPVRQEPSVEAPPVVNRSAEPNDIRAFVRAHPHCTDADLERYFTKKAISKARILGKIIKKGKTYQI